MAEDSAASSAQARLASEIRREREVAGLSQSGLAKLIGYSRNYVSVAERAGSGVPSRNLIDAMDRELKASGRLIALRREAHDEQVGRRASGQVPAVSVMPSRQFRPDRNLTTAREAVLDDARDAARAAREIASSSTSAVALDQLDVEIRRLASDYVSQPLIDLFGDVLELRTEVFRLLEANRIPSQMRDLYLHASRLGGLQAHVSLDLGEYRAADIHAQAAWLYADLAGHNEMRAWARALQSLIAYWDDRYGDAVKRAREGASCRTTGSVAARLPSLEARACAARSDEAGALDALKRSEVARGGATGDEYLGVFTFPEAKQAVYAGTTLLALDEDVTFARRASQESQRALGIYATASPGDRSSGDILAARLDLASASLTLSDLDATREHLGVVLATPPERRTASIVKRAKGIGERLTAARYAAAVRGTEIRSEIREFCALPAGPSQPSPAEAEEQ